MTWSRCRSINRISARLLLFGLSTYAAVRRARLCLCQAFISSVRVREKREARIQSTTRPFWFWIKRTPNQHQTLVWVLSILAQEGLLYLLALFGTRPLASGSTEPTRTGTRYIWTGGRIITNSLMKWCRFHWSHDKNLHRREGAQVKSH